MPPKDVIIAGGGLAGLTCAIHLSHYGLKVLLIEKNAYPKHKVCGEYVSNEVLSYLQSLGFDPFDHGAKKIDRVVISSQNGDQISAKLPLGGFGLSRYTFDSALLEKAISKGAAYLKDTVSDISFEGDQFRVETKENHTLYAKFVIGAFGKRSLLDQKMGRGFMEVRAPFLAAKAHYKGDYPEDLVGLYNFSGGYCGVSNIENNTLNLCYIADYAVFKKYKNLEEFREKVIFKNERLRDIFKQSEIKFDNPLAISQISFVSKPIVEDHVLMCGDSAGMIHPLCGNGMGMAIRSASILSETILTYFGSGSVSREEIEKAYIKKWNLNFKKRVYTGRILARFFRKDYLSKYLVKILKIYPALLPMIISSTHGKPMKSI
jgi:flavin-dependent dehydrogenase